MRFLNMVGFVFALSASMAVAGDVESGVAAFNAKDYEKALRLLQPAADHGVATAQGLLARIYGNGWGTPKDRAAALKWARLAAAQGNSEGENILGNSFRTGEGVTQDFNEALRFLRLSADQGNPRAQGNLGRMYRDGQGVEKNYEEAIKWFRLSAAQGSGYGQGNLGYMYLNGFGVERNYEEALRLLRLSADQGGVQGQNNLGYMYRNGLGVQRDYGEAIKWYRLSAAQGDAFAQQNLGLMYEGGLGVKQNFDEAARWYLLSAAQGNEFSKEKLKLNVIKVAVEREREAVERAPLSRGQFVALHTELQGLIKRRDFDAAEVRFAQSCVEMKFNTAECQYLWGLILAAKASTTKIAKDKEELIGDARGRLQVAFNFSVQHSDDNADVETLAAVALLPLLGGKREDLVLEKELLEHLQKSEFSSSLLTPTEN